MSLWANWWGEEEAMAGARGSAGNALPRGPAPAPPAVNGRAAQNVLLSLDYKIGYTTAARVLAVVL